jgi:molecular chaperone DnaK
MENTKKARRARKVKKEAEEYAAEDFRKRKLAESKNQADNLIYQARKLLQEYQDKIPQNLKEKIEEKIKELENVKNTAQSFEEIDDKIKELNQLLQEIGKSFYQK